MLKKDEIKAINSEGKILQETTNFDRKLLNGLRALEHTYSSPSCSLFSYGYKTPTLVMTRYLPTVSTISRKKLREGKRNEGEKFVNLKKGSPVT